MVSLQSGSASSGYAPYSGYAVQRAQANSGPRAASLEQLLSQDLKQSGLSSDVRVDDLLSDLQSSIKSALNDPANQGKDLLQVAQETVRQKLEENGVDVDKLASLLQSQTSQYPQGPGASNAGGRPSGPPRHGPPPGGPPPGGRPHGGVGGPHGGPPQADESDETTSTTASELATSGSNSTDSTTTDSEDSTSLFERLLADLLKSLPSGSLLDVEA